MGVSEVSSIYSVGFLTGTILRMNPRTGNHACMIGVYLPCIKTHRQSCIWADTTQSHASNFSELLICDVALAAFWHSKETLDNV